MITVHIPEQYLESLDFLVMEDHFPNRSEAIRTAIRDLILNEMLYKERKKKLEAGKKKLD